jgi:hypothetical protein
MIMIRFLVAMLVVLATGAVATAQPASAPRPPVIDMHVHSTNTTPDEARSRMTALNVRYLFVAAVATDLAAWSAALKADQFLPSLSFPCPGGKAAFVDRRCWDGAQDLPDLKWLREELRTGRIKALGELIPQYFGMFPADERLEPYWQLAEEFDIPVAIHLGPGPPGAGYESSPSPIKFPAFRATAGDPLRLEEVLVRHKRLRVLVMHAGWPRLESMIALLYAHPNVYVDVGALQAGFMVPRPSYYAYLKGLVDNGFARRIVFGSDFPNQVAPGIDAIMAVDFLTAVQKADILCGNAARYLRLSMSVCAP